MKTKHCKTKNSTFKEVDFPFGIMGLQQGARPVQAWKFRQQPDSEPRCYRGFSIFPSPPRRHESPTIDQSSLGKLGSMGLKPMNPQVGHPGVRNACKVCSTNTSPSASKTAGSFPGGASKRNTRRRPACTWQFRRNWHIWKVEPSPRPEGRLGIASSWPSASTIHACCTPPLKGCE